MSKTVVILGAGPCGLACAYKILKNSDFKVIVIDKESFVGGFGGSFNWKEYVLDFGPHTFHARGDEPELLVRNLFKDDIENLIEGEKKVSLYLKGKFYNYPLKINEALRKFNPFLSIRIIIEFMFISLFHAFISFPIENFEIWGKKRFGPTLYRLGFGDYSEKVWKTKASRISAKFASEKIQGFSFLNLIKKLVKIGGEVTEPYFQTWLYPRRGSGEIYNRLANKIKEMGGSIILNADLASIAIDNGRVNSVDYSQNSKKFSIKSDYVVSTIQLGSLIKLISSKPPFFVLYSGQKLRCISLIIVYLEFDMDKISDMHWFYLLHNSFRFNRVAEQKNLYKGAFKKGKTVLSMELTCRNGDEFWRMSDEELINMAKEDISRISIVDTGLISDALVKRFPDVYEIYYKNFDRYADISLSYIHSIKNLFSIGRRGLFLQGDQHQSVEMGLEIENILIQGEINDNSLKEYTKKYARYLDDI